MKTLLALSLLLAAVLGWFLYSKLNALDSTLREQQRQIQALDEKLVARGKIDLLDLQERCSNQARKEFQSLGYKSGSGNTYMNHYNAELNKCFILIETNDALGTTKILSDAYEGQVYGQYFWLVDKVKKYWEVPPRRCKVTLPSGEEKVCTSSDEFDSLIKIYMEGSTDQKAGKLRSQPQK